MACKAIRDWSNLPDEILVKIFGFCDLITRLNVPDVCRSWQSACHHGETWRSFVYCEHDLIPELLEITDAQHDEQLEAINKRISDGIRIFGKCFRSVTLHLTSEKTFDVLEPLANMCRRLQHLTVLRAKSFWTPTSPNDVWLKSLLLRNTSLRHVCIEDFDFMAYKGIEAIPLGKKHAELTSLSIVNSFLNNSINRLARLVNLEELWLSPQLLDYFMIKKLSLFSLRNLYIVVNRRCSQLYMYISITGEQWQDIRQVAPHLKVHCRLSGGEQWSEEDVLLNVTFPMASLMHAKSECLDYTKLVPFVLNYSDTLNEFIDCYYEFPEPDLSVVYHDRVDQHVLEICRECTSLHTLCLKTVVSSSMLLLVVRTNKSLRHLYIREDTIQYCWDLPVDELVLGKEDIEFAKQHWSQQKLCEGISNALGYNWKPLSKDSYTDLVRSKYNDLFKVGHTYNLMFKRNVPMQNKKQ